MRRQLLQPTDAPAQPAAPPAAAGSSSSSKLAPPALVTADSPRSLPPRQQKGSGGSLLSNSMDTYATQRGVLWKPDKKEVYTSVAFVLHQHIITQGQHLIVRSNPPSLRL